jgi:hypothetical protein
MKVAVLLALLGLLAVATASVVDLTPDNFDQYVNGEKHAFVEFFAPWYAPLHSQLANRDILSLYNALSSVAHFLHFMGNDFADLAFV